MLRKICFWLLMLICLGGCARRESHKNTVAVDKKDTRVLMMEYLRRQNLPALWSVEIWQNSYGPGLKLTTEHYDVRTTFLESLMLSQIPAFMESAYRSYNNQLPQPVNSSANKFTVYLFESREQWEAFTKVFAGPNAAVYCKIKAAPII